AHTHVGDALAKEAGAGLSLDELVAPPDGLKHRILRAATREESVAAMRRAVRQLSATGTTAFADFREGGVAGVQALREAALGSPVRALAYGRGDPEVLEVADGYGASGARDDDFERERHLAREAGKPFAIHAGERDPADVNDALDLDPDFLVHMVHTTELHRERVADSEVPVVVCPRSNLVTDVGTPDVATLRDLTTVTLGTDNVMLNSPSMFREMAVTAKCCDVSARAVLQMATRAGAETLGLDCGVIEAGRPARLLVVDGTTDNMAGYRDPIRAVVRRAGEADVRRVVHGGGS
ncbi:MAG: amidohydrolase family protein, partial [Halobacteriaceae archaeon]